MSNSLLAAALSAITNRSVITYDDYSKGGHDGCSQLDQKALHQSHLVGGRVPTSNEEERIRIFIMGINGRNIGVEVWPSDEIRQLKENIKGELGIEPNQQRLIFAGKQLEDNLTLASYKIGSHSTIQSVVRLGGGGDSSGGDGTHGSYPSPSTVLFIHPDSLAPSYDYDFTQIDDKNFYARKWYDLAKCKRFLFGNGIYSTPDIDIAYQFATRFTHDGDNYKVVFQNRVNPNSLVKVSKEETGSGEFWISQKNDDLRPYGICIKKEN
ncbi:ubiquitin-like protein [Rhizophagus irregularis]|uniref:Ubiquitin-like protein n=1 Tax=Rhizophagus irregularis TaxID=588596 RepID=A0A2N1M8I6_9GLOM|nr:ubiquitin-like protein [Rhizophagus irregularis]